jgi:hypothetical protein
MRQGSIQHRMQEMNPLMGIPLGHPKELPLYCLNGILFHIRQHEEPCVGYGGERTIVIGTVTTARARWPIDGAVLQIGRQRVLDMRQPCGEFLLG